MKRVGVIVAAFALAACGQVQPTPAPTVSPSAAPSGMPTAVATRSSLPSCGAENATTQNGPWNAEGRACFWTAYEKGQPAEFTSTRPTTEGDPITSIYRVLGQGRVEVFIDSTRDKWGVPGWTTLDCRTLGVVNSNAPQPDFGPDDSCTDTKVG